MEEKTNNEDILKESGETAEKDTARGGESKANTPNALLLIIAVLVIMSGVQVFQTQKLLAAVSSGAVKANTQTQGSPVGLPSQVGGCG